ncbi:hypothetical protein J4558_09700 [Leptolyngbya sp. 15MV]|nr:hypothetical protein J4558_09700 [Leptolyngbya sp. 15MV]
MTHANPLFTGGINIAIKIPPHQFEAAVAFYRDTLGLRVLHASSESVCVEHGPNRLHLDRVPHVSHAEVWLEVVTPNVDAAAPYLAGRGVTRCDAIEALPAGFRGFWIAGPAGIVTLVSEPGAGGA